VTFRWRAKGAAGHDGVPVRRSNSPHPSPRTTRINSLHTHARAGQTHNFSKTSASVSLVFWRRGVGRGWARPTIESLQQPPRKAGGSCLRRTLLSASGHITNRPWRRPTAHGRSSLHYPTPPLLLLACGTDKLVMHLAVSSDIACGCTKLPDQLVLDRQTIRSNTDLRSNEP